MHAVTVTKYVPRSWFSAGCMAFGVVRDNEMWILSRHYCAVSC